MMHYHNHTLEDYLLPETGSVSELFADERAIEIDGEPIAQAGEFDENRPESQAVRMERASETFTY